MGTAERRDRERKARRRAILRAAAKLFSRDGWRVRVEDVARDAEVAKGTVYLHFRNKEELYLGALSEGLDMLRGVLEKTAAQHPEPQERLRALAASYLQFSREREQHFRLLVAMHHGGLPEKARSEVVAGVMEKGLACWRVVAQAIVDGQNTGAFGTWPPLPTAVALWAGVTGAASVMRKREALEAVGLSGQEFFDLVVGLLGAGLRGAP